MPYSEPFRAILPEHRKKFNSTRLAGIEWEYNVCQEPLLTNWNEKWRGQRHSEHTGGEAVTAPIAGDYIAACLQDLGNVFQKEANINQQCAIHVHIDCEDLSWGDMYRLMWVYGHIEDILFKLGGDWRKGTSWCHPCGTLYRKAVAKRFEPQTSSPDVRNEMLDAVYCGGNAGHAGQGQTYYSSNHRKSGGRYRGLNLTPWLYAKRTCTPHQTVEFRMHENTADAERVTQWTHLLVQLVDWVKKSNDEQALRLSKNAVRALCKIAPQSRKWIIKRLRGDKIIHRPKYHTSNSITLHYLTNR